MQSLLRLPWGWRVSLKYQPVAVAPPIRGGRPIFCPDASADIFCQAASAEIICPAESADIFGPAADKESKILTLSAKLSFLSSNLSTPRTQVNRFKHSVKSKNNKVEKKLSFCHKL